MQFIAPSHLAPSSIGAQNGGAKKTWRRCGEMKLCSGCNLRASFEFWREDARGSARGGWMKEGDAVILISVYNTLETI